MADQYLKPQIPLKDLNSEDYFYPLTTHDQVIVTQSRLSAFMNESNNNLLNLTNIGAITSTGKFNLNGDLEIPNNHSFIGILGSNSSTDYTNVGGLTWFNLNGTAGAAANVNDTPTSAWWYIIRNRHTNTGNNYYTDLAIPFNSPSIYYKRVTGNYGSESIQGNKWVKVLDEDNYSSTIKTFTNTITGDILSAWHLLAGRPSNTTNFRTYFETIDNLHHDNPARTDSEMSYNRFFASNSDQTTYGPDTLNLPVVDQHILSFGIDNNVNYSRHIALDIRTNKMFLGGRINKTWQAWSEVIVHDLAQTISGQKTFTSLVKINTNGNTVTIGSANNSWCHFENSANIPFYFNKQIQVNGNYKIYNNNTTYNAGWIELSGTTPYIDFHYNNSTADYTSRIVENASGRLYIPGKLSVGYTNDSYSLAATNLALNGTLWMQNRTANIQWSDSGSWSGTSYNSTASGGLHWTGSSDWVKIFTQETARDKLDLIFDFGDDTNPEIKIRDRGSDKFIICAGNSKMSFIGRGGQHIYLGPNDSANGYNGALNNLVIDAWYGVSFTTSCTGQTCTGKNAFSINTRNGYAYCGRMYNAVWNDYAEFRQSKEQKPGICVQENDNGILTISDKRLIPGAGIISDTYGYVEGETEKAKTPIAVSGRVLVYTYQDKKNYHAGMSVCSAPNGTIDIMTREEIQKYPDAIIGIVSEIPEYKTWGIDDKILIDNRIWIKVRY